MLPAPAPFDLAQEAEAYVRSLPHPQTDAQVRAYVCDLLSKDEQADLALKYFRRDSGIVVDRLRLLEFGCGIGGVAFAFERDGAEVVAADIDARALELARRWGASRGSRVEFVELEPGARLPFDDASFDVVFSSSTFEHIAEPQATLRELARIIKPSGTICLSFPNRLYPGEAHTNLKFLPWMPRPLAARYLAARLPGWNLDSLWFYGYPGFLRVLRSSKAPLRVVCPAVEGKGIKDWIKRAMHAAGIPYSAVTEGLSLQLVRTA